ncbi:MAG: 30S ribosomal protein S16 [Myxococcota bacterium]
MVVIRLSRGGTKKRPFYRMVVADSRMSRDGRFIEQVGTYDPRVQKKGVCLRLDRIDHWLHMGARPSETVHALICKNRKLIQAQANEASVSA